MQLTAANSVLH